MWALRWQAKDAFGAVFEASFALLRAAATISATVAARSAERYVVAGGAGLQAVADLSVQPGLPDAFRRAAHEIEQRRTTFLRDLREAARPLEEATAQVLALDLPHGALLSMVGGAANATNPTTAAGAGALGGAALGTIIFPGIGTAIGAGIGAILGQSHMNSSNDAVVNAHAEAFLAFCSEIDLLFDRAWDVIAERTRELGMSLECSAFFRSAETAWDPTCETALDRAASEPGSARAITSAFIEQWGPLQPAVCLLARLYMDPYGRDESRLGELIELAREVYPADVRVLECAADAALELGRLAEAQEIAEAALANEPDHAGLAFTRLEAIASLGQLQEAVACEETLRGAHGDEASRYLARGLVRAGAIAEATRVLDAWTSRTDKPDLLQVNLRRDPVLRRLFESGIRYAGGEDQVLAAIVQSNLEADGKNTFFGNPPGERAANARAEFLGNAGDERVVFFLDWSIWGNAKTGLALTSRRIVWRCAWSAAVSIDLYTVDASAVGVEGSLLHVGSWTVDCDTAEMAAGLGNVLIELARERA